MTTIEIRTLTIDDGAIRALNVRARNQMFGCMHAHNELTALNRLLMFSMNETGSGELHDSAYSAQMWCILQLLSGKLFETWKMINGSVLSGKKGDAILHALDAAQTASVSWLRNYFGDRNYKSSPLKFVRDTTAFHYGGLDFGESLKNLAKGESDIFLAQRPANTLYWIGTALVFRTLYAKIAEAAGHKGLSHGDRVHKGANIVVQDAALANQHMHIVLYGLIKAQLDTALGDRMKHVGVLSVQGIDPDKVKLPTFVDLGPAQSLPPPIPTVVRKKPSLSPPPQGRRSMTSH
jgi:hypothetical protein